MMLRLAPASTQSPLAVLGIAMMSMMSLSLPVAAQEFEIKAATDYPGGDYQSLELKGSSPEECRKLCTSDDRCKAFTYVQPRPNSPSDRCYLKSNVAKAVSNSCCVSGRKVASPSRLHQPPTAANNRKPALRPPGQVHPDKNVLDALGKNSDLTKALGLSLANKKLSDDLYRRSKQYWRVDFEKRGRRELMHAGSSFFGAVAVSDPRRIGRMSIARNNFGSYQVFDVYYCDKPNEYCARPIFDGRGRFAGRLRIAPNVATHEIDFDADGVADFIHARELKLGNFKRTVMFNEAGLRFVEERLRNQQPIVCGISYRALMETVPGGMKSQGLQGLSLGQLEPIGAALSSLHICPASTGQSSSSSGGDGFPGTRNPFGGNANAQASSAMWDRMCRPYIDQPGGLGGTGLGRLADDDPREFDWGAAFSALLDLVAPTSKESFNQSFNPQDEDLERGVSIAAEFADETVGRIASAALTVVEGVQTFLEAGSGEFVNEQDRELYGIEQFNNDPRHRNVQRPVPPHMLHSACTAGSTSPYCEGYQQILPGEQQQPQSQEQESQQPPQPAPPPSDGQGGATGGDGGSGETIPDPGSGDNARTHASMRRLCRAHYAGKARFNSWRNDMSYIRTQCTDPRVNPDPAGKIYSSGLARHGAESVSVRVYCRDPGDSQQMMAEIWGQRGTPACPPEMQPGPDGTCQALPGHGSGRGGSGAEMGSVLEARGVNALFMPCNPALCNPRRTGN